MEAHTCPPSTRSLKQESHEFKAKASLGCIAKLRFNKKIRGRRKRKRNEIIKISGFLG
jgi:hypothetical protein